MNLTSLEHDLYQKVLSALKTRRGEKDETEFSIPNLFTIDEWSKVPNASRMKIGKLFKIKVDENLIPNAVFCYKNDNDWAVYKLIF